VSLTNIENKNMASTESEKAKIIEFFDLNNPIKSARSESH
jgi:hypothetical protein